MGNLDGRVAIVTGASRGIGRTTALELAANGASVVLAARTAEACEPVVESVVAGGGEAASFSCDVSHHADVERLVDGTLERFERVDVLVNNAGVVEPIGRLEACDPESWQKNIMVNLVGAFYGTRAVLPHFRRIGGGVIVNLSSGAAHRPLEGWSAYCAGKAGVAMLTQAITLEAGDDGVRVYGFQPGVVDTAMQGEVRASGINEVSELKRKQLTDPMEPARMISWLCTDEAVDLAGQELSINDQEIRRRAGLED